MKPLPAIILTLVASTAFVRSEVEEIPPPGAANPPRLLNNIPDGTPPPPKPPKPPFVVAKRDILSTTAHQQDGRTITLREIKPIALPAPPAPSAALAPMDPAVSKLIADYIATHPKSKTLFLGATVYRSKTSPPRTLVHSHSIPRQETITFWSSADFSLIAGGIHSFVDSAGQTHTLFMSWGNVDIDRETDLKSNQIREANIPIIPKFPDGKAIWELTGKQPTDPNLLIPIQSLHDIYNNEHARLLTAYQGREDARLKQQAYLKAHPPQPKNITLNYWRTEKPATTGKGAAK